MISAMIDRMRRHDMHCDIRDYQFLQQNGLGRPTDVLLPTRAIAQAITVTGGYCGLPVARQSELAGA